MPRPEVCGKCKIGELWTPPSDGEARLVGHILLDGQYVQDSPKRQSDLKRVATAALNYFDSSPEVRTAVLDCADSHIDGSCEFVNRANFKEEA